MNAFMSDGYLITNPTAERLYSAVRDLPIFDYHCHLVPEEIYSDPTSRNFGLPPTTTSGA